MLILSPADYGRASTADLLAAAARGEVGVDHRWLRELIGRGDAVVDEYMPFLELDHDHDVVELGDVLLDLVRHFQTPRALPFLSLLARAVEYDFPDELIQAFLPLGQDAVEPLLAMYEESGGSVDISFALASLGVRDDRILKLLVRELDKFPVEAAISLTRYGDLTAKSALEARLNRTRDDTTRFALEQAIKELGHREPEPPEPFDIWPNYPEEAIPEFEDFDTETAFAFLDSPEALYRSSAAAILVTSEPTADLPAEKIEARLLELARNDPDAGVRGECWAALFRAADKEEVAVELMARFANPNVVPEERGGVLFALAPAARDSEPVRQAILDLAEDPAGRQWALTAMARSGYAGFGETVLRLLDDEDVMVRRAAIGAAGRLGLPDATERVERMIGDPDLRDMALEAYVGLASDEVTPEAMTSLFDEVEDLAGGLDEDEADLLRGILDDKLIESGYEPMFSGVEEQPPQQPIVKPPKVGRNDPCPCGSGKKYKKCCGQ